MIPSALIARLKMLTDSTIQATEPVRPIRSDPPPLNPGDRIRAVILSTQPDGTYRAEVEGRPLTLSLPSPAKQGDQLELVVTARDMVATQEGGRPAVTARIAQPPTAQNPAPQLSTAAKLIGTLLAGTDAKPVVLAAGAPLMAKPGGSAGTMAPLLRDAVKQSGVFYEAHQAQWVEGKIALQSLREEPQAKLPPGSLLAIPSTSTLVSPERGASSPGAVAEQLTVQKPASDQPHEPGHDVTKILHKQLDTLATQQLSWQVQLWPGQQMDWEIDAPSDREARSGDASGEEWQTRLRLTLPELGQVSAELSVRGDRVMLRLHADDADRAGQLQMARPELARAFEAAGLQLAQATVDHRD